MKKFAHNTALISAIALTLVSCDSSTPDNVFDEVLLDDSAVSEKGYLSTGQDPTQLENSWFCTYTRAEDNKYLDRKQIRFWDNGAAMIDASQGGWNFDGVNLSINYDGQVESYSNIVFAERFSNKDVFNAASDNGIALACDWSGPPREAELFNDGAFLSNIEETTGSTIDVLLSTGRSDKLQESYWLCELDPPSGGSFELFLFDDGSMLSDTEGRWTRQSSSSIEIAMNGAVELWSDISIQSDDQGVRFGYFEANAEFIGPVSCNWSGTPRATAWTGIE